jgi:hypothetical protein
MCCNADLDLDDAWEEDVPELVDDMGNPVGDGVGEQDPYDHEDEIEIDADLLEGGGDLFGGEGIMPPALGMGGAAAGVQVRFDAVICKLCFLVIRRITAVLATQTCSSHGGSERRRLTPAPALEYANVDLEHKVSSGSELADSEGAGCCGYQLETHTGCHFSESFKYTST